MSGGEMQLNLVAGSEPGQASNSDDVQDVVASSSRLMRNGLEAMMHKIRQEFEIIPDDVLREFVSARVEEVVPSTVENYLIGWTRLMEKKIDAMVTHRVHQAIPPIIEDLLPNIVKENIASALEKFLNTQGLLKPVTERELELKFQNKVSPIALLGEEIKGEDGRPLRVALVDKATAQIVNHGPGASAKVEISLLDSNSRIMSGVDKTKPHFTKSNCLYLNEGVVELRDVKLGHPAKWTKKCSCRLEAKMTNNLSGIKVNEALTSLFEVKDGRKKSNKKHNIPQLSSEVWRLLEIDENGAPCKRLADEKVETVRDFLFLLCVDPQRLKKIVGRGDYKWNIIVDHAKRCVIDDNKIYVYCPPLSSEGVVFDAVGGLKGMIHYSHYVPINSLSEDQKARAQKLLLLAFKNGKGGNAYFNDDASLVHQYPCRSSGTTNDDPNFGTDLTISRSFNLSENSFQRNSTPPTRGTTAVDPNNVCLIGSQLESTNTTEKYEPSLGDPCGTSSSPLCIEGPSYTFEEFFALVEIEGFLPSGDCRGETSDIFSDVEAPWDDKLEPGSDSSAQNNGRVTLESVQPVIMVWFFGSGKRLIKDWVLRARNRVNDPQNFRANKRQKTY